MASTGNAVDFGNLTAARKQLGALHLHQLVVYSWVVTQVQLTDVIDFITIPTTGNAEDFGDLLFALIETKGVSSSTRAVMMEHVPHHMLNNTICDNRN